MYFEPISNVPHHLPAFVLGQLDRQFPKSFILNFLKLLSISMSIQRYNMTMSLFLTINQGLTGAIISVYWDGFLQPPYLQLIKSHYVDIESPTGTPVQSTLNSQTKKMLYFCLCHSFLNCETRELKRARPTPVNDSPNPKAPLRVDDQGRVLAFQNKVTV